MILYFIVRWIHTLRPTAGKGCDYDGCDQQNPGPSEEGCGIAVGQRLPDPSSHACASRESASRTASSCLDGARLAM